MINEDTFKEFLEYRKGIKHPFVTAQSVERFRRKCERYDAEGLDVNELMERTIDTGKWQDLKWIAVDMRLELHEQRKSERVSNENVVEFAKQFRVTPEDYESMSNEKILRHCEAKSIGTHGKTRDQLIYALQNVRSA